MELKPAEVKYEGSGEGAREELEETGACMEGERVVAMLSCLRDSRGFDGLLLYSVWILGVMSGRATREEAGATFSLVMRPLFSTNLEEREW